jgi:MoaA/NifB/PqqE/SkfB family radical SAM enzyme
MLATMSREMLNIVEAASPFHPDKLALHQERVAALAAGEMVAPQTIEVDVTDGFCNQACVFCCFNSGPSNKLEMIDPVALRGALSEAYTMGTRAVELVGGGEPTTHPNIAEIIRDITEIGDGDMEVGIITNGVKANRLLPVADNLAYVRVSLDSADPDDYARLHNVPRGHFKTVLKNIEALRGVMTSPPKDRKLGVAYLVVPPQNHQQEQVIAGAELAHELGVDYIAYRPVEIEKQRPPEEWQEAQIAIQAARGLLRKQGSTTAVYGGTGNRWDTLKPGGHPTGFCSAKPMVAVIQANGDIAFCILHRNKRDMKVGNIYQGGFKKHWNSNEHVQAWKDFRIDDCPNPCKFYRYKEVVDAAMQGADVKPPPSDQIVHHNFV